MATTFTLDGTEGAFERTERRDLAAQDEVEVRVNGVPVMIVKVAAGAAVDAAIVVGGTSREV